MVQRFRMAMKGDNIAYINVCPFPSPGVTATKT